MNAILFRFRCDKAVYGCSRLFNKVSSDALQTKTSSVINLCCSVVRTCSVDTNAHIDNSLEDVYNVEEKKNIIDVFNRSGSDDLQSTKLVSKQKADDIVKYRQENGDFHELSCLFKIPGLNSSHIRQMCSKLSTKTPESLLKQKTELSLAKIRLYPKLNFKQCEDIESVLSLDLQHSCITWAKLTRDLVLEEWDEIPLFETPPARYEHIAFESTISHAIASLPEASIVLLPRTNHQPRTVHSLPFFLTMQAVEAVLITLINKDYINKHFCKTDKNCVYLLRSPVVAKFFDLEVGGVMVSGEYVIKDILDRNNHTDVTVPAALKTRYLQKEHEQQNAYASALLQAIALIKLVVVKSDYLPRK